MRTLAIVVLIGCGSAPPARPPPPIAPVTPLPPEGLPLAGTRGPDVPSLLPGGYVVSGDYFPIEKTDHAGCLFATSPGKLATDKHRVIVLYQRNGFGTDKLEFIIDDVIEVPAATSAEQLTSACDGKPTIAILAWADHCSGMPARAQRAWRIVHGKLEAETAAVSCMRVCDNDL